MNVRTNNTPVRALINADYRINDPKYSEMLDQAICAYERSKVVADRELELLAVGVEVSTRWVIVAHNN